MASLLCLSKTLILPTEPSLFSPFFSRLHFPLRSPARPKAVFVLGSSGTGKSKLAIGLAVRFGGEVINSDKMQAYDGLHVITNKVTHEECAGVAHHLIGGIRADADFTSAEFRRLATALAGQIAARGRLPIIAGGSNSYIKELITGGGGAFASRFDCCFIWADVDRAVLEEFVAERVDCMVKQGLVEEARGLFQWDADYTKGVRRSIGLPELDRFFRVEAGLDEDERLTMLSKAFQDIKESTWRLTRAQRDKIRLLGEDEDWELHRVDATEAVERRNEAEGRRVWEETVVAPSVETVRRFMTGAAGFGNRCADAAGEDT